jgi:uncharacterized membrane protein
METSIIIWIIAGVQAIVFIISMIKLNERNGMFYYAAFSLYLKEKGLSKEEIEEERMKWAHHQNRIHKLLWPRLYKGSFTEDDFRGDIVKLMKALDIE